MQWVSDLSTPSGITLEVASEMTATCIPPQCLLLISRGVAWVLGNFKISQVVLTCSQVRELLSEGEHDLAPEQHMAGLSRGMKQWGGAGLGGRGDNGRQPSSPHTHSPQPCPGAQGFSAQVFTRITGEVLECPWPSCTPHPIRGQEPGPGALQSSATAEHCSS